MSTYSQCFFKIRNNPLQAWESILKVRVLTIAASYLTWLMLKRPGKHAMSIMHASVRQDTNFITCGLPSLSRYYKTECSEGTAQTCQVPANRIHDTLPAVANTSARPPHAHTAPQIDSHTPTQLGPKQQPIILLSARERALSASSLMGVVYKSWSSWISMSLDWLNPQLFCPCRGVARPTHADHFHLDNESNRDLGGSGGWFCFGEDLGVDLAGCVLCVPMSCARTHSYTALQSAARPLSKRAIFS